MALNFLSFSNAKHCLPRSALCMTDDDCSNNPELASILPLAFGVATTPAGVVSVDTIGGMLIFCLALASLSAGVSIAAECRSQPAVIVIFTLCTQIKNDNENTSYVM